MDGYRWERHTGEDFDWIEVAERDPLGAQIDAGSILVATDRIGEFAAFVAGIAREVGKGGESEADASERAVAHYLRTKHAERR